MFRGRVGFRALTGALGAALVFSGCAWVSRVSVRTGGAQGTPPAVGTPAVSGDGRWVAFESDATTLVRNDGNSVRDVFVHDRVANTTTRVSVDSQGGEGDGDSTNAEAMDGTHDGLISADRNRVAFDTDEPFSTSGTNDLDDVYVRDLGTQVTTLVSKTATNGIGTSGSDMPAINADGTKSRSCRSRPTWQVGRA